MIVRSTRVVIPTAVAVTKPTGGAENVIVGAV